MRSILIVIIMLPFSCQSIPVNLEDIRYYASDYRKGQEGSDIVAYTLKSSPCLIIESKKHGTKEYCKLPNNIDLTKNRILNYIKKIDVRGGSVHFGVMSNKKKYTCRINLGLYEECAELKVDSLYF